MITWIILAGVAVLAGVFIYSKRDRNPPQVPPRKGGTHNPKQKH